jgi:serine protease Do
VNESSSKFAAFLAIIATPLAAGAFLMSWGPGNQWFNFSPTKDGYVAPRDISSMVDRVQESTVTVICKFGKRGGGIGTGWAIDSDLLKVETAKTAVVTNHHVIEDCLKNKGEISIARLYKKERAANILVFDKKNDLAVLETDLKLKPLELSKFIPWPGYWTMVLGSADGYEGSISFGNVLNNDFEELFITNNISVGNSGSALIDNEGKVIGMVTWGMDYSQEQYNGAKLLDVFCKKVLKCEYEWEGEPTWLNYDE